MVSVWPVKPKGAFALLVFLLLLLGLGVFVTALPETVHVDSGCCAPGSGPLAKDFSAYYVATWRLIHDPGQVYARGTVPDGGPQVSPRPQAYKYLPSFLVLMVPSLLLPYQSALLSFDIFQFLLMPLIALLTYRITRERGLLVSLLAEVLVVLQPLPTPGWGLSATYFWQWGEGQSKLLVTFLLVLALYLAKHRRPVLAGVACALSAFDPRFLMLAVPLLLSYSRGSWTKLVGSFVAASALLNLPLVLPGVAAGFVSTMESGGALTPPYYYAWIPIIAVVSLTLADWRLVREGLRPSAGGPGQEDSGRELERQGSTAPAA